MAIYPDKGRGGKFTDRWRVEVQLNGRRARGRFDTLEEAKSKEKEWKKAFEAGEVPQKAYFRTEASAAPRTLVALTKKAYGSLWQGKAIARTNYQKLDIIASMIGDIPLTDLTTAKIDELAKELHLRGVKPNTKNRYYSCLNTLLKWGQKRGYVTELPSFPWEDEDEGRIREITEAEEHQLISFMRSYPIRPRWEGYPGGEACADMVTVAIRTGLRRGELQRVKLEHIENDQVTIWITKTKKARTVPLDPETAALLRTLALTGMPRSHTIRYFWDRAKHDMGLQEDEDFVFHACRHTCCTRLIRADINVMVVKKWMGHKRIETTLRYTHLNDSDLKDALKKLSIRQLHSTVVDFPRKLGAS
jgi:integrase